MVIHLENYHPGKTIDCPPESFWEERPKVLVVDDDQDMRIVVQTRLERLGWEVDSAESAEQALTMTEAVKYDAVSTDFDMPGMNGATFARVLRKRFPLLPVIMISGNEEAEGIATMLGIKFFHKTEDPDKYKSFMIELKKGLNK